MRVKRAKKSMAESCLGKSKSTYVNMDRITFAIVSAKEQVKWKTHWVDVASGLHRFNRSTWQEKWLTTCVLSFG